MTLVCSLLNAHGFLTINIHIGCFIPSHLWFLGLFGNFGFHRVTYNHFLRCMRFLHLRLILLCTFCTTNQVIGSKSFVNGVFTCLSCCISSTTCDCCSTYENCCTSSYSFCHVALLDCHILIVLNVHSWVCSVRIHNHLI